MDGTVAALRHAIANPPKLAPGDPVEFDEAKRRLVHSRFPARHVGKLGQTSWGEAQRAKLAQVFASIGRGGQVIVLGDRGTGKTQAAGDIALAWHMRGYTEAHGPVVYWRVADLMSRQKRWLADRNMGREYPQPEPAQRPREAGLLILDDAHDRTGSPYEATLLSSIVDERYGKSKPTLILTNDAPNQAAASLGASVWDRCRPDRDGGARVVFDWKAFRN